MSTPAMVPMFSPDGQLGDVPQQNAQAAMSKGYKLGVSLTSPEGKEGIVPHDRLHDAMTGGMMPTAVYQGMQGATAARTNLPAQLPGQQAGPVGRFLDATAANAPTPSGILHMLHTLADPQGVMGEQVKSAALTGKMPDGSEIPGYAQQVAGMVGANAESLKSDVRNSDYAGLAGDIAGPLLVARGMGEAGRVAGLSAGPTAAGDAMRATGENIMNKAVLQAKTRNMKYGANPGAGVLENTPGVALTKGGLASSIDDALYNKVGPQVKQAYSAADARGELVHPQELVNGTASVFDNARRQAQGLGGSDALSSAIDSQHAKIQALAAKGPLKPSDLWQEKMLLDKNTNWANASERDINAVKQDLSSSLGDILDNKAPDVIQANRGYQNLKQASKLANGQANSAHPFQNLGKAAGAIEALHQFSQHGNPFAVVGAGAVPVLTSTPGLSSIASGLYHGGVLADAGVPFARGAFINGATHPAVNDHAGNSQNPEPNNRQHYLSPIMRTILSKDGRL